MRARPFVLLLLAIVPMAALADQKGTVTVATKAIVPKAPECAPLFVGSADSVSNIWESAKLPALHSHCARLQSAVDAFRDQKYAQALELAAKAESDTPGQAGPWVVRGEAYARWGRADDAVQAFKKAKTINARALDDAETLDDYGSVLVRLGDVEEARKTYRALLPRVSGPTGLCGLKTECDAAGLAYLTAGEIAFEGGPTSIDEAVAILREARSKSDPTHDVRRVASLALALALDRRGDVDQAKDLATEIATTKGVPSEINGEILARLVAPEEAIALRAIGLEQIDQGAALDAWKSYLSKGGDKRPWAAHAKTHISALEKAIAKKPKVP